MLVKSKGNTVEIAPGVMFVENNHSRGRVYLLETITEVDIVDERLMDGKPHKQYRWQARNIETGEIVNYCITEEYRHYGPTLFQSLEDGKEYWDYWNNPKNRQ
jgi:hypothetical protein